MPSSARAFAWLPFIVLGAVSAAAQGDRPQPIRQDPTLIWYRGGFSDQTRSHDIFEWVTSVPLGAGTFLYERSPIVPVSLLELDRPVDEEGGATTYYSFRGPLCLLTQAVDAGISGRGLTELSPAPEPRWWRLLLHAHNSSVKWRLARSLRLNLGTRTDLLPLRIHGDDQGLLFTPQLGLEWVGLSDGFENDAVPLTNRLHLGVGYANWWSFEGNGRTPGWTVTIAVGFLAGV